MPVFAILNASPENVIFEVWCMLNLAKFKFIVDRLDAHADVAVQSEIYIRPSPSTLL